MLFVFSWFCLDGLGLSEGLKSGLLELSFNKKFFDNFIHNKPPITYLF